eukprot:320023_1
MTVMVESNCRVYVGNMDYKTTSEELGEHMKDIGPVRSADVVIGRTGRSRGYGLVEFNDSNAAQKAIETMDQSQLGERTIFVRQDRPAEELQKAREERDATRESPVKAKRVRKPREQAPVVDGEERTARPAGPRRQRKVLSSEVLESEKGRRLFIGNVPFRS